MSTEIFDTMTSRKSHRLAIKFAGRTPPTNSRRSCTSENSSPNRSRTTSPVLRSHEDERLKLLTARAQKYKALLRRSNLQQDDRKRYQEIIGTISSLMKFFRKKLREGDLNETVVQVVESQ